LPSPLLVAGPALLPVSEKAIRSGGNTSAQKNLPVTGGINLYPKGTFGIKEEETESAGAIDSRIENGLYLLFERQNPLD
jgi:hypothetical protein